MSDQYRIVIIDDEKIVLDSCKAILESSDYQIDTAPNGTAGLRLVTELRPDLVFVDLKMPGIPGLEVIKSIHDLDPTIVTIVITGFATVGSAVDAMKLGAYDFLPKPFTPAEFRLITKRGLERRSLVLETATLRREKEMLSQNFAAIISHELKSPLGAVQQNLYALEAQLSDLLNEDQRSQLDRMKVRVSDLIELIHTWLRAISIDIETIKETFEPISIKGVITRAIESVEPHAVRKDISLITSIEEPVGLICGDSGTLTEVLVNLCTNAIKYSYPGSEVIIRARNEDDQVMFSVSDMGIGISEEDLPFIFEDFYKGSSNQIVERGHGLGLALSRRIVEIHNGSISVKSKPGQGSTFEVRIPALEESKHQQSVTAAGVEASRS